MSFYGNQEKDFYQYLSAPSKPLPSLHFNTFRQISISNNSGTLLKYMHFRSGDYFKRNVDNNSAQLVCWNHRNSQSSGFAHTISNSNEAFTVLSPLVTDLISNKLSNNLHKRNNQKHILAFCFDHSNNALEWSHCHHKSKLLSAIVADETIAILSLPRVTPWTTGTLINIGCLCYDIYRIWNTCLSYLMQ